MADPKPLYREIVELERQLRELLRANPLNAADANALRSRLVEKAQAIADASAAFAAAKEIEQVLWKPCFYRRIEDFRRRIRKYAAASAGDRSVREHFARVSAEFQHFLTESAAFYDHLRGAYAKALAAGGSLDGPGADADADAARCRQSLHRCFIFLGDLARYRELHSHKAKKNFAAAEGFYHKALALVPANGNPHNQLAVLATYVEAETVAVYRYCRSLLTAQPFATAEENLALLFERTRQRPLVGPAAGLALTSASSARDKSALLKSFLHRLARLHGILFAAASLSSSGPPSPLYPREMEALLFQDLDALLRAGAVGDALLLKVVITNVFCVERARQRGPVGDTAEDALRLAARTLTSVMAHLHNALTSDNSSSSLRLLGPVSVFCDFLRLTPAAVDVLDAGLSRAESPGGFQNSHRAFLDAFTRLVNHAALRELYAPLVGLRNDQQELLRAQQRALKENLELRGFAPFAAMLEPQTGSSNSSGGENGLSSDTAATPEATAVRIRAWNLHNFARFLCDEYEGNPLLYEFQGAFSTSPTVGGGVGVSNSSFLHAVAGTAAKSSSVGPMPAFNLFGAHATAPETTNGNANASANANGSAVRPPAEADDDFDDEVIVFQPSPALAPMVAATGSNALGGGANASWTTSSPFADLAAGGPFSLGAPNSQSTAEPKRNSFSDSFSSGFGGVPSGGGAGAIGSSLGYPSFHSFGGDFGGFSGQGLLSGWGNSDIAVAPPSSNGLGRPPSVPKLAGAFGRLGGPAPFSPMLDLAAVERESALYQQEASSLSAFFGSPASRSSSASSLSEGSSARSVRAPPPGFGAAPLGNGIVPARRSETGTGPPPPQVVRTRNPFVGP
ncbi:hypothetical protein PybrP1_003918 [[Pythium] brassicae (nom. inval.)]|nr:hypothetical protein PybrP1_003918 [[Pythium] brassicae (nom. inval.)]